ncbi:MAG: single-stranded DNA-binding protein [Saprospiraceae bacterium]|nr:single-stranded DNA-binding protein [Saprospiraceae bacterium]
MKNLMNRVQLIGNLGKDVETKELSSGNKLAKVSIATNETYSKNGVQESKTYWHNLVAWGKTAELMADLCKKGSQVAIQGKLTNRDYQDENGNKRIFTEVIVDEFYLVGKREKAMPF